jgi:hypothetical protein
MRYKIGDTVKVKKTGWIGKVDSFIRGSVVIDFGAMREPYPKSFIKLIRRK